MLVKTFSAAVTGLDVTTVCVEVSMVRGVQFHLTGLADTAVKESYDRIKSALLNNGFKMPTMDITANLSPADIKKEGSGYDLPLALGILAANGKVTPTELDRYMLVAKRNVLRGHRVKLDDLLTIYPQLSCSVKDELNEDGTVKKAATIDMFTLAGAKSTIGATISQNVQHPKPRG